MHRRLRGLRCISYERLGVARGDSRGAHVSVLALNATDPLGVQFACGGFSAIFAPGRADRYLAEAVLVERVLNFQSQPGAI